MHVRGLVLVTEGDQRILRTVVRGLRDKGIEVVESAGVREAQRRLAERVFDGLVVDNSPPEMAGLELTREVAQSARESGRPQILLMTDRAALPSALEAMRLGAAAYVVKPFELDELVIAVERALELQERRAQIRYLMGKRAEEFNHHVLLGASAAIQGRACCSA